MIRHGIAQHNVVISGQDRRDWFDPDLTTSGRSSMRKGAVFLRELLSQGKMCQQSHDSDATDTERSGSATNTESLRSVCGSSTDSIKKNVTIVSSPLSRCLETSMMLHGEISSCAPELVTVQPLYCHELLREAYGVSLSDRRRKKSELKLMFPSFQFDEDMTEEDELWTPMDRETVASINERIFKFVHHIASTYTAENSPLDPNENETEAVVILVTHGVWMECCLHHYAPYLMQGGRRVYNGDVYRAELKLDKRPFLLQNVQFVSSGFQ